METEKINLMDFSDGVLHDGTWASKQPANTKVIYLSPKGDSGNDDLSLAIGEGRNGGNALRVRCNDKKQGVPGFWLMPGRATGRSVMNYTSDMGYMVPRGKKPTKLHMWLKFPKGFMENSSSKTVKGTPNSNFVVGTYQYAPGQIDGKKPVKESSNWHGYHQFIIRHDLADGDWVHVVLNDSATHQRSYQSAQGPNYCGSEGQYWDLLTRMYFDVTPYFADPEIDYPFEMLVDSIYFTCDEPEKLVDIEVVGYKNGQIVEIQPLAKTEFDVVVRNLTDKTIDGKFALRCFWSLRPSIEGLKTKSNNIQNLKLNPYETKNLKISFTPKGETKFTAGLVFVPTNQVPLNEMAYFPSMADPNVGISGSFPSYGPHDTDSYGTTLGLRVLNSPSPNPMPVSQGGMYFETKMGQVLKGEIDGFCSSGNPLKFNLISTQKNGGNFILNENGNFTFTPDPSFKGSFLFRYQINNGAIESLVYGSWILVK
jgi:hypothetical protein